MIKENKMVEQLKAMATDDYQNRNGNYPKSDIPDSIQVCVFDNEVIINASFKNTDETTAKNWLKTKLSNYKISKLTSAQTGDYHNDWVEADAHIKIKTKEK
jgi:hypothetical protein